MNCWKSLFNDMPLFVQSYVGRSSLNQRLQLPSLLDVKVLLGRHNVTGLSIWTFGSNLLLEFQSFYRQAQILTRMRKRRKKKVPWHSGLLKGTVMSRNGTLLDWKSVLHLGSVFLWLMSSMWRGESRLMKSKNKLKFEMEVNVREVFKVCLADKLR